MGRSATANSCALRQPEDHSSTRSNSNHSGTGTTPLTEGHLPQRSSNCSTGSNTSLLKGLHGSKMPVACMSESEPHRHLPMTSELDIAAKPALNDNVYPSPTTPLSNQTCHLESSTQPAHGSLKSSGQTTASCPTYRPLSPPPSPITVPKPVTKDLPDAKPDVFKTRNLGVCEESTTIIQSVAAENAPVDGDTFELQPNYLDLQAPCGPEESQAPCKMIAELEDSAFPLCDKSVSQSELQVDTSQFYDSGKSPTRNNISERRSLAYGGIDDTESNETHAEYTDSDERAPNPLNGTDMRFDGLAHDILEDIYDILSTEPALEDAFWSAYNEE